MSVVIIGDKVSQEDLDKASEEYGEYIKIVVDIVSGNMAIGGEWHADAEKTLIENGSKSENIWGGGIDRVTKNIETVALINLRPNLNNNSQEIIDPIIRSRFTQIVKQKFEILF